MKNLESKLLQKYGAGDGATTTGSCVLESFDDFQKAAKHEAKALVTQSVTNKKAVGPNTNPGSSTSTFSLLNYFIKSKQPQSTLNNSSVIKKPVKISSS